MLTNSNHLPSEVLRVHTPNGTLFCIIIENLDGTINSFHASIGKAGNDVSPWAIAMTRMMTLAIEHGATLEDLIETLSELTSGREARTLSSVCRSGPEGLWMALVRYKRSKFAELAQKLGVDNANDSGPSVGNWARVRNR